MTSITSGDSMTGDQRAPMPSHTPGPWRVDGPRTHTRRVFMPNDTVEIRAPHGGTIACLYRENFHGQDEANARLISAAPEMLTALKVAKENLQPLGDSPALDIICAAIARAEGCGP